MRANGTGIAKTLAGMAVLLVAGLAAGAQSGTPTFTFTGLGQSGSRLGTSQKLDYLDAKGTATTAGTPAREILRGNGTRAGYALSHGGIIPSSVRIAAGSRSLRSNLDYYLDAQTGALFFAEAVRSFDSISVSYRYLPGNDQARSSMGLPGLSFNLKGTSLQLGYGLSHAENGLDFTSYGLGLDSKLGGASSLNGLLYFSTPAASNRNMTGNTAPAGRGPQAKAGAEAAKSGHLILQNLSVKTGSLGLRATYQDVGASFQGFQAMRAASSGNKDRLSQIGLLERERGIKRLGFGGTLGGPASSLALDWDRIQDKGGDIVRQSLGFASGAFSAKFATQEVEKGFSGFKQLRESQAAQWANERGLKRSDLTLGFAPKQGAALGFQESSVADGANRLSRQSFTLSSKGFSFGLLERSADPGFGRIANLTDAEKTAMALDIRKQYNPSAQSGEVTAKDKEQLPGEAGLIRRQMGFQSQAAKGLSFSAHEFSVGDKSGEVSRRTFQLSGKGFSASYLDQTIGDGFSRLGRMSDFERSMLGNERGIHRTALGLNLALGKGSGLQLNQASAEDSAGGMERTSLSYQAKGLDARLNIGSTDKGFSRSGDLAGLSKEDRAAIEAERGFKRSDFTANLTSLKNLKLSTYTYDARNAADEQSKTAYRHALDWAAGKATRVSYLTEGNGFSSKGRAMTGRDHDLITLDHLFGKWGKINLFRDTLAGVAGGIAIPRVSTNFLRFETDRSRDRNLFVEAKRTDFGNGKYENLATYELRMKPRKNLALQFTRYEADRGADPSSWTNGLNWDWMASKTVQFAGSYALTSTNTGSNIVAKSFALTSPLSSLFSLTGSYSETAQRGKGACVKAASDIAISTKKPANLGVLTAATMTFKYTSLNDKKRLVKEIVSGGVNGMLGKNQVALEYGGSLNEKGQSAQARTLQIVSDRNAKLPYHFDMLYKAVNLNRGSLQLIRKYNFDLSLAKATTVKYAYTSLPEGANNAIQAVKSQAFSLNQQISKDTKLAIGYTVAEDLAKRTDTSKLSALLSSQIDALTAVGVEYSVDLNTLNGQHSDMHTFRVSYDHRVDGDNYLGFSTLYSMDREGSATELRMDVDYKLRF